MANLEPTNGSWIQTIAELLGSYEPVNGSYLEAVAVQLNNGLTGGTGSDNYVTGGTLNAGTLTLSRQNGDVDITGFSSGGGVSNSPNLYKYLVYNGGVNSNFNWRTCFPLSNYTTTVKTLSQFNAIFQFMPFVDGQTLKEFRFRVSTGTADATVNIGLYKLGVVGTGENAYVVPTSLVYTIGSGISVATSGVKDVTGLNYTFDASETENGLYAICMVSTENVVMTTFNNSSVVHPGWGLSVQGGIAYRALSLEDSTNSDANLPTTPSTTPSSRTDGYCFFTKTSN